MYVCESIVRATREIAEATELQVKENEIDNAMQQRARTNTRVFIPPFEKPQREN